MLRRVPYNKRTEMALKLQGYVDAFYIPNLYEETDLYPRVYIVDNANTIHVIDGGVYFEIDYVTGPDIFSKYHDNLPWAEFRRMHEDIRYVRLHYKYKKLLDNVR